MASPQRNKMSLFPESRFGVPVTGSGGSGYQVNSDGTWNPLSLHNEASETYTGAQAPLAGSVDTVIKGYQGTYRRAVRTHGEELWWRGSVGKAADAAVALDPQTRPETWIKRYTTRPEGPDVSYTIVQDRFSLGSRPGLYQTVYRGAKIRGWSLNIFVDQPILVSTDFVCPWAVTAGGRAANPAPYPTASRGTPLAFDWTDVSVRIGDEGVRGSSVIGFLRYFRFRQDNKLDVSRYYTDGETNLVEPVAFDVNTGGVDMEFDYAAVVDTELFDRYEAGELVSVEMTARKGPFQFRLWLPSIHFRNVNVTGQDTKVGTVTATGDLRYNETLSGQDAVLVELISEGSNLQ